MHPAEAARAVAASLSVANSLGLGADDALLLSNNNALVLRLLPCDVVVRVSPSTVEQAQRELNVAAAAARTGLVAGPDPRVPRVAHERHGFAVSFWTYVEPVVGDVPAPAYADALRRFHDGLRELDVEVARFTDRVETARRLLGDPRRTPDLPRAERDLLSGSLAEALVAVLDAGRPEQLLHGEPHPGNVLNTTDGPRFIDFETCVRGPVEFDVAHAPPEVSDHYPGLDEDVLTHCRILVLAMITTWRWDRDDQFPDGRRWAATWSGELRELLAARR